ncbi:DUF4440 domain-containing protein [Rhodococcus sp. NPDC058639]|uniref:nuclear transport factor 2 family protein n=1 Tax=Rhodococcus sp. NPDC058639 TaxID=3346570 RepID=UPI0036570AD6
MDDAANEPDRRTAPELHGLLEELEAREPIFHHPPTGFTREEFDRLVDPHFWETGASGRRYSREYVWSILEERSRSAPPGTLDWQTSDFQLRELAPSTYLLTYTLLHQSRLTRRATVWQDRASGWTILYHQGTPVAEP